MPKSFLASATFFIAGWNFCANINPIPNFSIISLTLGGSMLRSYPKYSKISALPFIPETDLFPCFATVHPLAAITKAAVVEMLNLCILSPPVPHTSIILPCLFGSMWMAYSCILSSIASNSSSVSPFSVRFLRNFAVCCTELCPSNISSIL